MNIAIASDHGGFELKQNLIDYYQKQGINLEDLGTHSSQSCDYPDIANKLTAEILNGHIDLGILICGTGIGISIAANRHKGIRAALLYDDFTQIATRESVPLCFMMTLLPKWLINTIMPMFLFLVVVP